MMNRRSFLKGAAAVPLLPLAALASTNSNDEVDKGLPDEQGDQLETKTAYINGRKVDFNMAGCSDSKDLDHAIKRIAENIRKQREEDIKKIITNTLV